MVKMLGPSCRVQVSLYLPEPIATVVQALRARFDPRSAQIIRPHITALYESELTEAAPGIDFLADCASMRQTFQVELSEPRVWNNGPSDGIYVGVDDVDEGISSLRNHFLMRGLVRELSPGYVPHVARVHAGRVDPTSAIRAWNSLESRGSLGECAIGGMSLIQESDGAWDDLASFSFQPEDQD